MSTYYKHKQSESIEIPYSFCCEHCLKESGKLAATIEATAELNSNFKNLNEKKQMKLDEMTHENLVREVKRAHTNATEKQTYSLAFKDDCPYCHKPQSWAISGAKKDVYSWPFALVIVGIIVGIGGYLYMEENKLMMAAIFAGVFFALATGVFAYKMIQFSRKKQQVSNSLQNNLPTIEWSAVQHLLDEA